jgi:ribonucleoside-diphosphate reductase alpha chain
MNAASVDVGTVIQGGSRRGAAMFMLDDWHPDIEEFINHKRDQSLTKNANISVAISDAFMERVRTDGEWPLIFPDTTHPEYNKEWDGDIVRWGKTLGYPVITYKTVRARELWDSIASAAHASGEPGIVFLERYNKLSTAFDVERIISVNPCGEQGLGAYSVCNLGSMNLDAYVEPLPRFVVNGEPVGPAGSFNFDQFKNDVKVAIRFLDNVIDKAYYGEDFKESYEQQMKLRRVGLSVQGLADSLIHLQIAYGSKEAIQFTGEVFKAMKWAALESSAELAKEKGPAGAWTLNKLARPFYQGIPSGTFEKIQAYGVRNLFLLTQAPTGTTSLVAGVNSGIEPYFAFELVRKDRTNQDGWDFMAPPYREYLAKGGDPENLPEWFVTTNDLTEDQHIDMMAAAQEHIDASISKTVNAPNSATVEGTKRTYQRAYEKGLKAVAYYRDGSRDEQVLNHKTLEDEVEVVNGIQHVEPTKYKRGTKLHGTTIKFPTSLGTAFVTVNKDDDATIREIFVNVGKAGSDVQHLSEAVGRLVSAALQHGIEPHVIRAQLNGVGGFGKMRKSLPTAIADAIEEAEVEEDFDVHRVRDQEGEEAFESEGGAVRIGALCPNCQEFSVIHTNGCMECAYGCGYTAC